MSVLPSQRLPLRFQRGSKSCCFSAVLPKDSLDFDASEQDGCVEIHAFCRLAFILQVVTLNMEIVIIVVVIGIVQITLFEN